MYKISILFENRDFEHDIYELIRAFYPDAEILVSYEKEEEVQADLAFRVEAQGQSFLIHYRSEENKGVTCGEMIKGQSSDALLSCKEDSYDKEKAHELRKEQKDIVKLVLYRLLVKLTGRNLPWGNLTGIRPAKLAMAMLESGMKNSEAAQEMRDRYMVSPEKTALAIAIANRERELLKDIDYENGYSLYVGIPFCPSICLYCSFSSYPLKQWKNKVDLYLDALCREIEEVSRIMEEKGRKLDTVYIGGGTPTTLEPDQLKRLLDSLMEHFDCRNLAEFTIEAGRPDSITKEKLQMIRKYPVTRISVNPQTMNQETLDIIGRRHTVEETKKAFALARECGFDNINMDLIVGLPGEDKEKVAHTLDEVRALAPDSLTVHSLAVKRAARLNMFKDQYQEMTFENNQEIMDMTMKTAYEMGMSPYYLYRQKNMKGNFENVGYAEVDKAGIYNILIMEEKQPIIALGAGGSSKLVFDHGKRIERVENVKDVSNYIARIDEMIERKRAGIRKWLWWEVYRLGAAETETLKTSDRILDFDLSAELDHGIVVSNLAYEVASEMGLEESVCYELAIAGMLHDIGKLRLTEYINGREKDPLLIEELKYVRMHSTLGYEELKGQGYSEFVLESILYHHENYDGTGYPENLAGEEIPIGGRILRVCDVFAALSSDRPYRTAFDVATVVELMIDEIKNFDMEVFLAFQRVIHKK